MRSKRERGNWYQIQNSSSVGDLCTYHVVNHVGYRGDLCLTPISLITYSVIGKIKHTDESSLV